MTLVLIGKGLVLGGWPSKIEVIWVLGIYTYIYILLGVQSYHLLPKREASWQAMWNTFGWWFIVASKIKLGGSWRYSIHFRHDLGIISLDMYIYIFNMYINIYIHSIFNIYIQFFIFRASLGGWYPTFPNTVCSDIWHVQFPFGGPRLHPPDMTWILSWVDGVSVKRMFQGISGKDSPLGDIFTIPQK